MAAVEGTPIPTYANRQVRVHLPARRTGGLLVGVSPFPAAFCSARASSLCFFSCLVSGLYLCASFRSCVAGREHGLVSCVTWKFLCYIQRTRASAILVVVIKVYLDSKLASSAQCGAELAECLQSLYLPLGTFTGSKSSFTAWLKKSLQLTVTTVKGGAPSSKSHLLATSTRVLFSFIVSCIDTITWKTIHSCTEAPEVPSPPICIISACRMLAFPPKPAMRKISQLIWHSQRTLHVLHQARRIVSNGNTVKTILG